MKIADARIGAWYVLRITGNGTGNTDYHEARIMFTKLSENKKDLYFDYIQLSGRSGNTSIRIDSDSWDIEEFNKGWDI